MTNTPRALPVITVVNLADLPFAGVDTDFLFVPPDLDYEPPYHEIVGVRPRPDEPPAIWDAYYEHERIGTFTTREAAIAAWTRAAERAARLAYHAEGARLARVLREGGRR